MVLRNHKLLYLFYNKKKNWLNVTKYIISNAIYRVPVNSSSTTPWTKVVDIPSRYICNFDSLANIIVFSPDGKLYFTSIK